MWENREEINREDKKNCQISSTGVSGGKCMSEFLAAQKLQCTLWWFLCQDGGGSGPETQQISVEMKEK